MGVHARATRRFNPHAGFGRADPGRGRYYGCGGGCHGVSQPTTKSEKVRIGSKPHTTLVPAGLEVAAPERRCPQVGQRSKSKTRQKERRDLNKLQGEESLIGGFDYKSWPVGVSMPMISALGNFQWWQEIEITV